MEIKKKQKTLSKDLSYAPAQDIEKGLSSWVSLAYDILWCNPATQLSFIFNESNIFISYIICIYIEVHIIYGEL